MVIASIENIILNSYEAALSPELWPKVFDQLSDSMNSEGVNLMLSSDSQSGGFINISTRMSGEISQIYTENLFSYDPRVKYALNAPACKIMIIDNLLDEEEDKKFQPIKQHFSNFKRANMVGANLKIGDDFSFLCTGRWPPNKEFTKEELSNFNTLLPHMRNAIRMQKKLDQHKLQINGLSGLWAAKSEGIIFINDKGKVLFANDFVEQLLEKHIFTLQRNELQFCSQKINKSFYKIHNTMCGRTSIFNAKNDTLLVTDFEGNEYGIRLVTYLGDIKEFNLFATNLTMVVITPLNGNQVSSPDDIHRFSQLYNLTEAEEQVVAAIAYDVELSLFAKTKNIKVDTARKQLKSALSKTGLRSQKQLVRLIDRFCFLNLK